MSIKIGAILICVFAGIVHVLTYWFLIGSITTSLTYFAGIFVGGTIAYFIAVAEKKDIHWGDKTKIVRLFTIKKIEDEIRNK